jgi:hypothetical protein
VKIIFLDFDGVLNSLQTKPRDPRGLIDWLDPRNVTQLSSALERTGASIVVTSSWRLSTPLPQIRHALEARGCVATVVGVTPSLHPELRDREISAWLESSDEMPDDWLVVDDESLEGLTDHQIRPSRITGFTEREALEIVRRFGPRAGT